MDEQAPFLQLSTGAARGAAALDVGRVDIFLPHADGQDPVLYQSHLRPSVQADLARLRENGVAHVFVRAADMARCEEALAGQLGTLLENPNLTAQDKAEVIQGAGQSVARELLGHAASREGVERVFALVDQVGRTVLADPTIAAHLVNMAAYERSTASHMHIVGMLAMVLGAEVYGPDMDILRQLAVGGILHDIGKLSIPAEILRKESPLTRDEVLLIQQHPIESVRLIGHNEKISPVARQMILQHHERIDGRGYPLGLGEASICREALLLAIVDSFHAVVGPRAYRAPLTIEAANRVLSLQAGKQFDHELLACWMRLCERQEDVPGPAAASAASCPIEERFTKHERSAPDQVGHCPQRHPRFRCDNRKALCIYAGRLHDVTAAPVAFQAGVIDVSRGGLSLQVEHPMFRGEILNVHLPTAPRDAWFQSMIAWCRGDGYGKYRIGLRLVRRINQQEARRRVECVRLGGMIADPEAEAPDGGSDVRASLPVVTPAQLDARLETISRAAAATPDDERFVIRLLDVDDEGMRLRAVEVLVGLRSELTAQTLPALLQDPCGPVRRKALAGIETLRLEPALSALRELLNDDDEEFALAVAGTLGRLGDWSGMQLAATYLEQDGPLQGAAVQALGKILGETFSNDADGVRVARNCLVAQRQFLRRQAGEAERAGGPVFV